MTKDWTTLTPTTKNPELKQRCFEKVNVNISFTLNLWCS